MEQKAYEYIIKNKLINKNDTIVIGVSGGADSVCLLYILWKLRKRIEFDLIAVHINHGMRGDEADDDANYVKTLCENLAISCHFFSFDIKKEAKDQKVSLEEIGRIIRYKCMKKIAHKYKNGKIAVAHQMNDQAETIIMNLVRGTGLNGLLGMSPKRDRIIRPLLECKREEIEKYLEMNNLKYRQDSSNFEDVYTRNKIRLNILPYIEDNINEKVIDHIHQTSEHLKLENDFINQVSTSAFEEMVAIEDNRISLNIDKFNKLHKAIQKRIIRKIIYNLINHLKNIESVHIEQIIELALKQVGKKVHLPNNIIIKRCYDRLVFTIGIIENPSKIEKKHIIDIPSQVYIKSFNITIKTSFIELEKGKIIPKKIYTKWFDYDKIKSALYVRKRKPGDYIYLNNVGKKKIKDFFIDIKVPKEERDSIPLLACEKHIIWIIGYRISEVYKVTEDTKRVLIVEIEEGGNDARDKDINNS
ncbi:MAG: tRNA lysidine(34) synthetase TilS [Eubacteriales bacterium]